MNSSCPAFISCSRPFRECISPCGGQRLIFPFPHFFHIWFGHCFPLGLSQNFPPAVAPLPTPLLSFCKVPPAGGPQERDGGGTLGLWSALPGWHPILLWLPFPFCMVWLVHSEDKEA